MTVALVTANSSGASTPDHASLDITGDIDVRVRIAASDWTPATSRNVIDKWADPDQMSWRIVLGSTGIISWQWTSSGAGPGTLAASVPTGFVDGADHWIRVTFRPDNGAAGRTANFYTMDATGAWVAIGTPVTSGTASSIFSGTGDLHVATNGAGGTGGIDGRTLQVEIRSGIDGTVVANPDFRAQAPGATSFVDSTGKTWTVNSPATLADDGAYPPGMPHLQRLAQENFGLDVNGAMREASGLDLDPNGVSYALWGGELYAHRGQAYALLGGT